MTVKIKWKPLIFWVLGTLLAGALGSLIGGAMKGYEGVVTPKFAPPDIVFPIVWSILYILMGVSAYLIYVSQSGEKMKALGFYIAQLIVNIIWPLFFFRLDMYLFSFIWLLLLIVLVIIMFIAFYKIRPAAAYLQIPYIVWLVFAAVLNYAVYTLN